MKKINLISAGIFMLACILPLSQVHADPVAAIERIMAKGTKGDDVKVLQALLAADENVYAEAVIDGRFGPITERAVMRFQTQQGLRSDGIVGPITTAALMRVKGGVEVALEDDGNGEFRPCLIVPPGHLIAPGWLRHNGGTLPVVPLCQDLPQGIVNQLGGVVVPPSGSPIITISATSNINANMATINWSTNETTTGRIYYGTTSPVIPSLMPSVSDGISSANHSVTLSNLSANTTYYFIIDARDSVGRATVSAQQSFTTNGTTSSDLNAPIVSSISASSSSNSTAAVSWMTDEPASSKVYYSVSPSVNVGSATFASTSGFTTNHSVSLLSLSSNTRYYYVIESTDLSGNMTRSSEQSFMTGTPSDNTMPVISSTSIYGITSSSATVYWVTNESATSKVYYSTSSPLNVNSSNTAASASGTIHTVNLSGLSAGTRYYIVIESTDSSGNMARSSEMTFVTM